MKVGVCGEVWLKALCLLMVALSVYGCASSSTPGNSTLPPSIASLNPTSGAVGTSVTITGSNFGSTQGTSTVTFGTKAAGVTTWSATSIVVTVPTGAVTGSVVVTVGTQASNGVTFTVTTPAPAITSLNPNSGPVGTAVTITGTNFGATQGTSTIKFNGTTATATSWSDTSIAVAVPAGATTGNVVMTVGTQASNGVTFTVTTPAPAIVSLNPNSGPVGTAVTITGTNFGSTQGTSTVTFGGTAATTTSWSATSIGVTVPTGATTGNVVVTVGTQASNGMPFTVGPTISSLNPNSGAVGTPVTITGMNFGATQGTSMVTFNGIAVGSYTSWSSTSIVVTVPTGATNGNVVVTVGTLSSTGVMFTISTAGPTITMVSPNSGAPGTVVTITGTNFGATQGTSTVTFGGTAAATTSWSATSIGVTVPVGATTGAVVVTVGGLASNEVSFTVPAPAITSLNPTSGLAGAAVTITGTNFGTTQGTSTVKFDGTTAAVTSWSNTSIAVTVPSGAATGNVVVTVGTQASNGVSFTVTTPAPTITTLNPTSGAVGSSVVITGTNFGATQGASTVKFNGTTATTTAWSATSITATVPTGATTGNVVVTVNGQASNGVAFTVSTPAPVITSLNPTSGLAGAAVTITGTNFGTTQGTSTVKFDGTTAAVTSWSNTSIAVTVPSGAATGNVVVTVGTQASNGVSFTVTTPAPTITTLNPTSGAVGSSVVITGTNFGATQGASTVKFNGTTATTTAWSATSITATVPTGATTGNVVVTVNGQASNGVSFTVTSGSITVSISPKRAGLTVTQTLAVTATTNDGAGVTWTATGGSFSSGSSLTAVPVTYTAASSAGSYTITATSKTDTSKSASITVGVTDLAGVATYHNNLLRDGTNTREFALTTGTVTSATFGKLFSCAIDGAAYAQPLWIANLSIGGGTHNVVFVATTHDSVYAFDADNSASCTTYWHKQLVNSGETYLNYGDVASGDIEPDIGIIGTPVIDTGSKTLYVVSKSKTSGSSCTPSTSCFQRLHALSLLDGSEKFGGPYSLTTAITVSGNGDGSSGGVVPFDTLHENQRPGLALVNGIVYITWASHGDNTPYHGWVIGFTASNIGAGPTSIWNSTPNLISGTANSDGGIWMSGGAPAADSSNDLYFLTGNGSYDGVTNYGDSTIRLTASGGLHVKDHFTPYNQGSLSSNDTDHGAGGAAVLVDPSAGPVPHLLIGGGKSGTLFLINRDSMGGYNSSSNNVVQSLSVGNGIFATPAFWNNTLYIAGTSGHLNQYSFNTTSGQFSLSHSSSHTFAFPGSSPSVSSSSASSGGIVWALDNSQYCTEQSPGCGPAVLHAYDATNVSSTELWNSSTSGNDNAGDAVKFTVPTIANGKVYVGTRSELDVYGLKPN